MALLLLIIIIILKSISLLLDVFSETIIFSVKSHSALITQGTQIRLLTVLFGVRFQVMK